MWWRYKSGQPRTDWMLEDRETLYTLGLVGLLLVAVMSYNNMKAKEEAQRGPAKPDEDTDDVGWLSKFAVQGGSVVGETVSIDGDQLILKQAGMYKLVPLSKAKRHGDEVVIGDVDWDAAMEAGAAWHAANTKGKDDAVTSDLTKSEDVKAPALEAFKERQGDEEE